MIQLMQYTERSMRICCRRIYRKVIEQQNIRYSTITQSAVENEQGHPSVRHQSSRCSQSRRNKSTIFTDPNHPSTIQGTIPLHGKGLKMSQYAEIRRTFTQEDVNLFGRLSGDMNPVHFPQISSQAINNNGELNPTNTDNRKAPIVHGILLSSLFSNIFGNVIPGAIYRHQTLKFHNPVHVNEKVVARVVVTKLRQINRKGRGRNVGGGNGVLCTCDTSVIKLGVIAPQLDDDLQRKGTEHIIDPSNGNNDEEMLCITGDAQVWLPDLQLVYECREKGEFRIIQEE